MSTQPSDEARRGFLKVGLGLAGLSQISIRAAENSSHIRNVEIAKAGPDNPRNDTASVLERRDGSLMVVWHKYSASEIAGSDFGVCRIFSKTSRDGGLTWGQERLLVDVEKGDLNVQAPALCHLRSGDVLLNCLRAHAKDSSSMLIFRSRDDGKSFEEISRVWNRTKGQWLQGGASSLVPLSSGRVLLPMHGGSGEQGTQHNIARAFYSDDQGKTWTASRGSVDLPMRGAMEASVAELESGSLIMSLRTQLGSVFLSQSDDHGDTWTLAQPSGLKAPESCTCLRRIPGTNNLILFWNDSLYNPKHHHYGERSPLSGAVTKDEGKTWRHLGSLATGNSEFTNLSCTFLSTGKAVVTYMRSTPPFSRTAIDLRAAIIDGAWFHT
jgi:sialidase-1